MTRPQGDAQQPSGDAVLENLLCSAREIVEDDARKHPDEEACCGSCESAPFLAREVLRLHEPDEALVERVGAARSRHSPLVLSHPLGYVAFCNRVSCGWECLHRGRDRAAMLAAQRSADDRAAREILAVLRDPA